MRAIDVMAHGKKVGEVMSTGVIPSVFRVSDQMIPAY